MAKRINEQIVKDFIRLQEELKKILDAYGVTQKYVYTRAGLARATFERKLKEKSFTAEEFLKICEAINN